ncbi:hypothetical protein HPP92_025519 [Vanilla planifolia]|uniref:Uncharacterized protein n=1 Tax=Vanilla planifolia TaxID=51239 RepID=A0A835PFI9_VANPL|nr:hypothetical protein HPP92_025519 [Vanilla planifolia]
MASSMQQNVVEVDEDVEREWRMYFRGCFSDGEDVMECAKVVVVNELEPVLCNSNLKTNVEAFLWKFCYVLTSCLWKCGCNFPSQSKPCSQTAHGNSLEVP